MLVWTRTARLVLLLVLCLVPLGTASAQSAAIPSLLASAGGRLTYVGANGDLFFDDIRANAQRDLAPGVGRTIHDTHVSQDGTMVAYLAAPLVQRFPRQDDLYVVPSSGGDSRALTHVAMPMEDVSWFPDNQRLLLSEGFNGTFATYVAFASGGDPVLLTPPPPAGIVDYAPVLSPDGGHVASVRQFPPDPDTSPFQIYVAAPDGSPGTGLFTYHSSDFFSVPSWTPDSSAVLYDNQSTLVSQPLSGTPPTTLVDMGVHFGQVEFSPDGSQLIADTLAPRTADTGEEETLVARNDGSGPRLLDVAGTEWAGNAALLFPTYSAPDCAGAVLPNCHAYLNVTDLDRAQTQQVAELSLYMTSFDWRSS